MGRNLVLLAAFTGLLAACGGGGGGESPPAAGPDVAIQFPTPSVLTDATTITVRGTTSAAASVTALSVNGVSATTSDGFLTWSASVPLSLGPNALVVTTTDASGTTDANAASVSVQQDPDATMMGTQGSGPTMESPLDVVLDRERGRLIVCADGSIGADNGGVFTVDVATGERRILSDASTGGGAPANLETPIGVTADFATNSAFVVDISDHIVTRLDRDSGLRSVVADGSTGSPQFQFASGIEYLADTNRVVFVNNPSSGPEVMAIDVGTGARTVLSDGSSAGAPINAISQLRYDATSGRLIAATDGSTDRLLAIDLTTGARTELASNSTGTGGPFSRPSGIGFDAKSARIVTHLRLAAQTVAVDPTTGNREVLSESGVRGSGPAVDDGRSLVVDGDRDVIYVVGRSADTVYVIDLVSGDRAILSK